MESEVSRDLGLTCSLTRPKRGAGKEKREE